jgi:calcineurin-like phosphoesterase family protein
MVKLTKFPWTERDRHFFTSDLHIFHDPNWEIPIWKSRGYENAEHAAEEIANKINERVGEDDILWNFGDLFLNADDDKCLEWLSKIKCKNIKKLWGNHHSNTYRLYKQEVEKQYNLIDVEIYPIKMGNVEFVGNHVEILIGKRHIVMNHFPLRIWNKYSKSSWMLSGHSHGLDVGRRPDSEYQKGLDCGWDIKKDVWSFSEIDDVMSTKTIEILDHRREN